MHNTWSIVLRQCCSPRLSSHVARRTWAASVGHGLEISPFRSLRTPTSRRFLSIVSNASGSRQSRPRGNSSPLSSWGVGPSRNLPDTFPSNRHGFARQIPRRDDSPLLPENYHADEGLSFRTRALSQAEIDQVFGRRIDPGRANRLLRVLHGRRIAGTVGDALPLSESTPPTEQLVDQGLAWLRQNYPVDETTAYEQRMEREVRQKTESRPDQGGGFTLYQPQMGINSRNVYGESGLDAIREHYNRQRTEKPMLYPEELKGRTGTLQTAARTGQLQQPTRAEKNQAYVERAQITKDPRPPVMSMVQRLLPSALFTGAVLLFSIYLADQYTPPPGSGRLWPDLPPAAATIFGLVIANTAIFVGWRIPMCWRFLNRHFLNVPGYPFSTSMLGSVFSHQAPWHLVFNMTVLWIVGTRLHDQIGRGKFLAVYLSSGVFGSFASLAGNSMLGRFAVSSLGASGAISGVFAAWCCLNMNVPVSMVFGLTPAIPAFTLLGLFMMIDLVGAVRGWARYDHICHLGGSMAGVASAVWLSSPGWNGGRKPVQREKRWWERVRDGK